MYGNQAIFVISMIKTYVSFIFLTTLTTTIAEHLFSAIDFMEISFIEET